MPPRRPNLDPRPADQASLQVTSTAGLARAQVLNRLGMSLLEQTQSYSATRHAHFYPESWRRADDGATYAFDSNDPELYQRSVARLAALNERYEPVSYLFSTRGLVQQEAVRMFREAARLGDLEAIWNLGWRYHLGEGVAQDRAYAHELWSYAGQMGHSAAQQQLEQLETEGAYVESRG
ncbi:MAG: hypothetical protein ACR2PZ_06055 [Pseudomonadales bacterium]